MIELNQNEGIAQLNLNAPPLNILTRAALREVRTALRVVSSDPQSRVLIISATGPHFSAGASVPEHLPPEYECMLAEFADTVLAMHEFPLPIVAAVQGRCLGGAFELVQAADLIVAAESAQFGQPEVVLGVFAPAACALLPQRIGWTQAAELLFTGDPITARAASAAGLVTQIVPDERLDAAAETLALRIARHSAAALRLMKRAMREAQRGSAQAGVAAATRIYINDLMRTRDALEGLQAFMGKREPEWCHQ